VLALALCGPLRAWHNWHGGFCQFCHFAAFAGSPPGRGPPRTRRARSVAKPPLGLGWKTSSTAWPRVYATNRASRRFSRPFRRLGWADRLRSTQRRRRGGRMPGQGVALSNGSPWLWWSDSGCFDPTQGPGFVRRGGPAGTRGEGQKLAAVVTTDEPHVYSLI